MKTDIQNIDDIKKLIDQFYGEVRKDEMLAPVFASRISADEWPAHLERMYAFWNAILFGQTGFQGNPMQNHLRLPIGEQHFEQWLCLFRQTIDELFTGEKAEEAKSRASSIAQIMNYKISSLAAKS